MGTYGQGTAWVFRVVAPHLWLVRPVFGDTTHSSYPLKDPHVGFLLDSVGFFIESEVGGMEASAGACSPACASMRV